MKRSAFTEEQIIAILRQAEQGDTTITAVCRAHGIAENTSAPRAPEWRQTYGGADGSAVKRLRELEQENARRKRLLAERDLEVDAGYPRGEGGPRKKMGSAQQRRAVVQHLRRKGLSLRRRCALVHISRSSHGYRPRLHCHQRNQRLVAQLRAIARKHPRYGYRRAQVELCKSEANSNVKRTHRLWREAQLCVPARRPRRRRADRKEPRAVQAIRPNQVWTYDFVHDACAHGQRLKRLTVTDEDTRQSLAIAVATTLRSQAVIAVLARLIDEHGAPAYLRSDNGPEFVASAVQQWLATQQVQTVYITPGSPWQNAYSESFNGRLRDECRNLEWFRNPAEAKVVIATWRQHYTTERPHSSLGYLAPLAFRAKYEHEPATPQDTPVTQSGSNPTILTL